MTIVDLFAGPGGWSEGLRSLGLSDIGLEWDSAACATRAAAEHRTIRTDLATYPPRPCSVLIASPPCQTFSTAGLGEGREQLPLLVEKILRGDWSTGQLDDRTRHVLTVGRWIDEAAPDTVALEQVPPVLPVWQAYADLLRHRGWSTWAGVLNAADYGVPQTRRRAFLIASRVRTVHPPEPTHTDGGGLSLFGELAPWVTMADALGWGSPTPRAPIVNTRGKSESGGNEFSSSSWAVTSKARSWTLHTNRDQRPDGTRQTRDDSAPAPALTAKAGGQWAWERPATTVCADPRLGDPGHRDREGGEPQFSSDALRLTISDALRLTISDALRLQSFRADYPVQGTRTKQFEQIGNAVPPMLAAHVAASALGLEWEAAA